ncbi:MAG: Peptidoglycan glycosyltransferase MrdB [bacterium]|nr:Peptidoglycan glycosyltransferase MrdB [bacterium]MCK6558586.1 rod shape-determining protein RodA [bacterium]NUM64642.1 rod shape-determining protein RodA [candidate division KSB1 bacterium]
MLARANISWKDIDKVIIVCVLLLVTVGLMAIYSTTNSPTTSAAIRHSFAKQIIWFLAGAMLASAVVLTPVKYLKGVAYSLYGVSVVLLILVLFVGGGKGVHRWFILGPVHFQPAEVAKIATLLALARYLSDEARDLRSLKDIGVCFAMVLVPTALILKEPDLGTAIVVASLLLPVLFWAGLSPFIVFLVVSPIITLLSAFNVYTFGAAMILIIVVLLLSKRKLPVLLAVLVLNVGVGALTPSLWNRLKDYQKTRILTFVGLQQDPRGTGYQVAQSQVAIGSGGFWGKGWARGTQTKLRFLPEQHTDFIFSVVGEELGFWGVTLVLLTFFVLLWRALGIAVSAKNKFLTLMVVGCVTLIGVHVIVNTGMTVGIMPVTGIPLPFLSYGGSSLWTNMTLVGLILNAGLRRFQY